MSRATGVNWKKASKFSFLHWLLSKRESALPTPLLLDISSVSLIFGDYSASWSQMMLSKYPLELSLVWRIAMSHRAFFRSWTWRSPVVFPLQHLQHWRVKDSIGAESGIFTGHQTEHVWQEQLNTARHHSEHVHQQHRVHRR